MKTKLKSVAQVVVAILLAALFVYWYSGPGWEIAIGGL